MWNNNNDLCVYNTATEILSVFSQMMMIQH